MKKQISFMMAALMLTTALASCGGGEDTAATADTTAAVDTAVTEAVVETEPVVTEPVTTEPVETEPPMVEVFTPVYEENFDSAEANWRKNAELSDFKIEGGFMSAVSTGGDPSFANKKRFNLDCSTITAIKIRYLNCTPSDAVQIFFTTDSIAGYNENDSFRVSALYTDSAEDSDEWNELTIYTDEAAGWSGQLRDLRVDITTGEGKFIVDYIAFGTVSMEPAS